MTDTRPGAGLIWPVVLSGGSGTRLWPLSRSRQPKQFLRLAGDRTLIQSTVARTADEGGFRSPVVIGNAAHAALIGEQLGAVGSDAHLIILEPEARNTAPAIALAAHRLVTEDPEAVMLVMPSDHVIEDRAGFLSAVDAALPFARDGWLVTFGIKPTAPETGYGYIRAGEALSPGVHQVEEFVEKPDAPTAEAYLAEGSFYWNGGIFLFRAERFLEALATLAPAIHSATAAAVHDATLDGVLLHPEPSSFAASPSDSIDYAVMERATRVAVVPVDVGWSDIGSWDALRDIGAPGEDGNVIQGPVVAIDTSGCLLRSDGPLIAAAGLRDLTVIATDDAVMLAPRGRSQDVKLIVDRLKKRDGGDELVLPTRISAAWGEERLLSRTGGSEVRQLDIAPGATLVRTMAARVQLTVLCGRTGRIGGGAALDPGGQSTLDPGEHRITNGAEPLSLLEVYVAQD